jgi:type III restriction enzyme
MVLPPVLIDYIISVRQNFVQFIITYSTQIIRDNRHALAVDGIRYEKLAGQEYYILDIFDNTELLANLDKNAVAVNNSVYDYIIYDSETVEKPFAKALDDDEDVKMFFKLPERFRIETPIGTYNPDWAVYLERNGEEKLFFVLETKGSTDMIDLRTREQLKIHCGKRHFEALEDVHLQVTKDWSDFKKKA